MTSLRQRLGCAGDHSADALAHLAIVERIRQRLVPPRLGLRRLDACHRRLLRKGPSAGGGWAGAGSGLLAVRNVPIGVARDRIVVAVETVESEGRGPEAEDDRERESEDRFRQHRRISLLVATLAAPSLGIDPFETRACAK